jgi:hypothetical protein
MNCYKDCKSENGLNKHREKLCKSVPELEAQEIMTEEQEIAFDALKLDKPDKDENWWKGFRTLFPEADTQGIKPGKSIIYYRSVFDMS